MILIFARNHMEIKNIDYQVFPIFTRNHINIFIP